MNHPQPPSELAWRLADYLAAGVQPPSRCLSNPSLTEGEMMTADEVEEFIKDSVATLRILSDKHSPRYDQVAATYRADLNYLVQCGSLDAADADQLADDTNLRF